MLFARHPFLVASLVLAVFLPGAAAAALAQGAGQPAQVRRAATASLVPNGDFESGVTGWGGYNASISSISGGTDGVRAARVIGARKQSSFSIYPTPAPVSSTSATIYTAAASVRSATIGRKLCLRMREWSGSSVVDSAEKCAVADGAWTRISEVSLQPAAGRKLDAYVFSSGVAGGSFDVDQVSVSIIPAPAPAPTPPPPAPAPTPAPVACTRSAALEGSDSAAGTVAAPYRTVAKLLASLSAGQTGCLAAGQVFVETLGNVTASGSAGAPITITSSDPARPATIKGRIVTKPGADYLTFSYLVLNGANATGAPSPTVGSSFTTFSNVEVTNDNTGICFNLINDPTWGTARSTVIDSSRIHNCGRLPATNFDHGIYISGTDALITNNWIYDNADRGVQLRGAQRAIVRNNIIDGNGEGVIFGDMGAAGNEVAYNVISNSKIRWNVESYWGSGPVGTGNIVRDNCVWNGASGNIQPPSGFTATANLIVDPGFVNRAAKDFALVSTSPCAAMGPR